MTIEFAKEHLQLVRSFFPGVDCAIGFLLALEVCMLGYLSEHIPEWEHIETRSVIAVAATLVTFGFSFIGLVCAPFPKVGGARSLVDFRGIAERTRDDFLAEYMAADDAALLEDVVSQIWRYSSILIIKEEQLYLAFIWFVVSLPPWNLAAGFFKGLTGCD